MKFYKNKKNNTLLTVTTDNPVKISEDWVEITGEEEKSLRAVKNANLIEANKLRCKLASTDYMAIKYAEGQLTAEEYEPMKQQRIAWREEINKLKE